MRQKHHRGGNPDPAARARPSRQLAVPSPGRRWLFRLIAVFGIPLLLLGVVELGLRIAGIGFDPGFFIRQQIAGKETLVANKDFGLRFFPRNLVRVPDQIRMPAEKSAGKFRIFIFGESAALGDPRPNYGASRFLEVLLAERFPQTQFEVINTSMTAINSHVILPIAQECSRHEGDLWIVYMGNNEMVGPFGAVTVFGTRAPPLWLARMQAELRRLRLGQLLFTIGSALHQSDSAADSWHGMEMFTHNQIDPDGALAERVYQNFDRNLGGIIKAGVRANARIILSTVAVNVKDCPPFGSLPAENLSPENRAAFEKSYQQGEVAGALGQLADARTHFEEAIEAHPRSAQARFQLGSVWLQLTNPGAAQSLLLEALQKDTLPFRANPRINEIIRTTARSLEARLVVLCDSAQSLGALSPGGIPGDELLYEHVHLNPSGNYALARTWATHVESTLPPALKQGARPDWASQSECERWLGLSDWNRVSILEEVVRRIQRPPFSGQPGNARRVTRLENQVADLRTRLTKDAAVKAREIHLEALRRSPDDFRLHENFAEFLEAIGDLPSAIAERKQVCDLVSDTSYFPHYALGLTLKEAGQLAEARAALNKAAALKPDQGEVRLELGIVCARQGAWEISRQQLTLARRWSPDDPRVALYLGEVLWKLDRRDEALLSLRDAIRLAPAEWQPHYRLASNLAQMGRLSDAAAEFQEAIRLNPGNVRSRLGLASMLINLGRTPEGLQQLDEVLKLDPTNQTALELVRKLRGF
jgi:tetratricopeptide (TPR) repeat protein